MDKRFENTKRTSNLDTVVAVVVDIELGVDRGDLVFVSSDLELAISIGFSRSHQVVGIDS